MTECKIHAWWCQMPTANIADGEHLVRSRKYPPDNVPQRCEDILDLSTMDASHYIGFWDVDSWAFPVTSVQSCKLPAIVVDLDAV